MAEERSGRERIEELEHALARRKYGLVWEMRAEAVADSLAAGSLPVLVREPEMDVPWSGGPAAATRGTLIEGDNLDALTAMLATHRGRFDVVAVDPPYFTGNQDFRYNDNFVVRDDPYKHSKWLSFMYRRFILIRELLAPTGILFVHIDDNEFAQLKLLLDRVFDEGNFITDILWRSRKSSQNDSDFTMSHNHTLTYARDRKSFSFRKLAGDEAAYANPDNDPRGPWKGDPFDAPNIRPNLTYPITNPLTGDQHLPPNGRHWRTTPEKFQALADDGRIVFGKTGRGRPQMKSFLSESQGKPINTWWDDVETTTDGSRMLKDMFGDMVFNNPKPLSVMEKLFLAGGDENALILDCFAGTGTTGHAVMSLNAKDGGTRRFVLATNNENGICREVTRERLRKASEGYVTPKGKAVAGLGGSVDYWRVEQREAVAGVEGMTRTAKDALGTLMLAAGTPNLVESVEGYYAIAEGETGRMAAHFRLPDEGTLPFLEHLTELQADGKPCRAFILSLGPADASVFEGVPGIVSVDALPKPLLDARDEAVGLFSDPF